MISPPLIVNPPDTPPPPSPRPSPLRPAYRPVVVTAVSVAVGLGVIVLAMGGIGSDGAGDGPVVSASVVTAAVAEATAITASGLTDVSDVAAVVTDSVVTVEVTGRQRGSAAIVATGSGVILSGDGTIVTNAHVVNAGTGIVVVLADGTQYEATVIGVDVGSDLAVVDIDATGLSPIELGTTDGLLVGDPVIAVGNPLGLPGGPSVSTGIVSALGRTLTGSGVSLSGIIQTDAAITEGSSGGALLDGGGRLVGITTAVGVSSVGVEGIGFAIPVEAIARFVGSLTGM